jgi:hypothetical protein|tara:strand:+ start:14443 stop:14871 length:429 start_codon:yes stop_codon:yes gene_type:complete
MKKKELKNVLKPLIKECIKEMLLEEGLLGNIIQEVVSNMPTTPMLTETAKPQTVKQIKPTDYGDFVDDDLKNELQKSRNALEEQMSASMGINVFEGLTPLDKAGDPDSTALAEANPLGDPNDPGVNISGILKLAGGRWGKFK